MDSGACRYAGALKFVFDLLRAADRSRRPIEGREKAVLERLHFLAAITREPITNDPVMGGQQVTPVAVAKFGGTLRRADDVGEQKSIKSPGGLGVQPSWASPMRSPSGPRM
jgi:hypothetical protein